VWSVDIAISLSVNKLFKKSNSYIEFVFDVLSVEVYCVDCVILMYKITLLEFIQIL